MDENVQIIPFYAHPHVFVVINDNTFYDEAVSTPQEETMPYSTCVVTGADSGRDNTFIRCDDLTKKRAIFGSSNFSKYGQSSLQAEVLFNGYTSVWFYRALPDDATYANMILLAKYRKGDELNEIGQTTGKKRLEIKFDVVYAAKPDITEGARTDDDIRAVAESYASESADPATGYMCLPIGYVRVDGRGKYGNKFAMNITRDIDAENEYQEKMYAWTLIKNGTVTRVANIFSGALYQMSMDGVSTLIDDVVDKFDDATCPVDITTFEENFEKIFDFYKDIVEENAEYIESTDASQEDIEDLGYAQSIKEGEFDPIFGYRFLTRTGELIPYYQNYTAKDNDFYVEPDLTIETIASRPDTTADWATAKVGSTLLVQADTTHDGLRWQYTVTAISETGAITYDEGVQVAIDADQYDGLDITVSTGIDFIGGSDGIFEQVTVDGVTRKPSKSEMKLLLAREQVKAFRGQKDRRILSPYRITMNIMFDANYNMTTGSDEDDNLSLEEATRAAYGNSTVLTDADFRELSVLGEASAVDTSDLDVKKAIYDLIKFRNTNGNNAKDEGAGCSCQFDCGMLSMNSARASSELNAIIEAFNGYKGRAYSCDLGYYKIFDPTTGRKVDVTVTFFMAQRLIPFIMSHGMNAPFVYNDAAIMAIQTNQAYIAPYSMIRDTFRPDIDIIDHDVQEKLYNSRINYWITEEEGTQIQRACQNTMQTDASDLLEENNVRVLNVFKNNLDRACRGYLYKWNDATARAGYTKVQKDAFRPWIGTYVEDLDVYFAANDFEAGRKLMHCYGDLKFFNIAKRIILEININRNVATENGGE